MQIVEEGRLHSSHDGGKDFDYNHQTEFDNHYQVRFDVSKVQRQGVHPICLIKK